MFHEQSFFLHRTPPNFFQTVFGNRLQRITPSAIHDRNVSRKYLFDQIFVFCEKFSKHYRESSNLMVRETAESRRKNESNILEKRFRFSITSHSICQTAVIFYKSLKQSLFERTKLSFLSSLQIKNN